MSVIAWSRLGVMVVGLTLMVPGCKKPSPTPVAAPTTTAVTPAPPQPPVNPPPQGGSSGVIGGAGVGGAGMDVKRTAYKTDAMNNLRTVAQFYSQEALLNNAPPDKNTFLQMLRQQAPKAYNGIMDGAYILVPNARSASEVVICYEKDPDSSGIHFTAFGDNSVQKLTTQQLQAALQVK